MKIVIFGLSITSSWGNGHATTYRALVAALTARGHDVLFLERDRSWYRDHRDLPQPDFCRLALYDELTELPRFANEVREADCVIVGSFVPEGVAVAQWVFRTARGVTAFYDIDTPVTLAKLAARDHEFLTPELIPRFDLYLSFTGGPTLRHLEKRYGSPAARAFHCSVDPAAYFPERRPLRWDLGYLGTYSDDRQPTLQTLLIEPAAALPDRRFTVVGPLYPASIAWPANVERIDHLSPAEHRAFYNAQRFTLNVTRREMVKAGWSPSVRLFEAAACGVPIISDSWEGLESFFQPGREILVARHAKEVREILSDLPAQQRAKIARRARERVLAEHTAEHRAAELEALISSPAPARPRPARRTEPQLASPKLS